MTKQDSSIEELDLFFASATLPPALQLDPGSKIMDLPLFVGSHLAVLKHSGSHGIYEVFYTRLVQLREHLITRT